MPKLKDHFASPMKVLFVGINPGMRSWATGHHFAGYSNRFWKLLFESGLVPERITYEDDRRLSEWGFGITNLIARPTPGISDLRPEEYAAGWKLLARKIRRTRPAVVALVGVTLYRAILPFVDPAEAERVKRGGIRLGPQPVALEGARVWVLPNPSGRNANYRYEAMLEAFAALKAALNGGADS